MALGLNIVVGFAGLLDLGYVAFFAIGAYTWAGSARAVRHRRRRPHPRRRQVRGAGPGIHINLFLIICIAGAFTALWGVLLGFPTLRLRGDYLAIVTLAFGEIVPRIFENSESGIFGIGSTTSPTAARASRRSTRSTGRGATRCFGYPLELRPSITSAWRWCYSSYSSTSGCAIRGSGGAWIAVREDEVAAASMGVNLVRTKLWAYALGAALGGFAGAFLATYNNTVNVDQFEFGFSVFILLHGRHRRNGQHLGRHRRGDLPVDAQPLHAARAERLPRTSSASTST